MNKVELLANVRSGRAQLESALAQFDDDQLLAPNLHGGWSIKDLIAHFGFWEERVVRLFGLLQRAEQPSDDEPSLDELNARAFAQNQGKVLAEVRREERDAYERLLALTEHASEEELFNPQRFAWTQGRPFADWIVNNTYGHYEEHQADFTPLNQPSSR